MGRARYYNGSNWVDMAPTAQEFDAHSNISASTTTKGHVQLSNNTDSTSETLAPTMKALNEVKLYANDIKTKWASVIGSPLVSTDTQAQLQTKTQTIKNALATNLTNKGQSSTGTETLTALVGKVANISSGKKFASGTATSNANGGINVSGIGFLPTVVIVVIVDPGESLPSQNGRSYYSLYVDKTTYGLVSDIKSEQGYSSGSPSAGVFSGYNGGFTIGVTESSKSYIWLAFG